MSKECGDCAEQKHSPPRMGHGNIKQITFGLSLLHHYYKRGILPKGWTKSRFCAEYRYLVKRLKDHAKNEGKPVPKYKPIPWCQ